MQINFFDDFKNNFILQNSSNKKEMEGYLTSLEASSKNLYNILDQNEVNKEDVISHICTIVSDWRALIREGSAIDQVGLQHALQAKLSDCKSLISRKMEEEKSHSKAFKYFSSIFSNQPKSEVTYENVLEEIRKCENYIEQSLHKDQNDQAISEIAQVTFAKIAEDYAIFSARAILMPLVDLMEFTVEKYQSIFEKKNEMIGNKLNSFTPNTLFPGSSFTDFVISLIARRVSQDLLPEGPIENLSNNIPDILRLESIKRISMAGFKAFVNVVAALEGFDKQPFIEFLQTLKKAEELNPGSIAPPKKANKKKKENPITDLEKYKQIISRRIADRLFLFCLDLRPSENHDLEFGEEKSEDSAGSPVSPIGKMKNWFDASGKKMKEVGESMKKNLIFGRKSAQEEDSDSEIDSEIPPSELSKDDEINESNDSRNLEISDSKFRPKIALTDRQKTKKSAFKKVAKGFINEKLDEVAEKLTTKCQEVSGNIVHDRQKREAKPSHQYVQLNEKVLGFTFPFFQTIMNLNIGLVNFLDFAKDESINQAIEYSKILELVDKVGNHSDVVLYYIMDQVTQEMRNILVYHDPQDSAEKNGKHPFSASKQMRNSFEKLLKGENIDLNNGAKALVPLVTLSSILINEQENESSLLNVTENIEEFLSSWENWIQLDGD